MTRIAFIVLAGLLGGCSGTEAADPPATHQPEAPAAAEPVTAPPADGTPAGELPFAQGRTFDSLDAYLAFLAQRGKTGVPWYRQIKPGVYELVSRRGPGAEPKHYTRAELLLKFGFTE